MSTIQINEPARIIAGDTAKWLKTLAEYPADAGWVLSYELVSAAQRYTVSSTASGADHLALVPAAETAGWVPGAYQGRGRVSQSGEVYTVAQWTLQVSPSFGAAVDARSSARRTLDAIEAVLEGRASSATQEYSIAGRSLKYIPIPELLALRDRYRQDVAAEENAANLAAGGLPRGRIFVRFGR